MHQITKIVLSSSRIYIQFLSIARIPFNFYYLYRILQQFLRWCVTNYPNELPLWILGGNNIKYSTIFIYSHSQRAMTATLYDCTYNLSVQFGFEEFTWIFGHLFFIGIYWPEHHSFKFPKLNTKRSCSFKRAREQPFGRPVSHYCRHINSMTSFPSLFLLKLRSRSQLLSGWIGLILTRLTCLT